MCVVMTDGLQAKKSNTSFAVLRSSINTVDSVGGIMRTLGSSTLIVMSMTTSQSHLMFLKEKQTALTIDSMVGS